MTQVISLLSESNTRKYLFIPQEILEMILVRVGESVRSAQIIMLVSTEFRSLMISSLPRVVKLTVNNHKMLSMFSGVKHLNVRDGEYVLVSVGMFDENVWKNMKSLKIHRRIAEQLASQYSSKRTKRYFLPSLTSLDISDEDNHEFEIPSLDISVKIFPSLRYLKLNGCRINRLMFLHFNTLRILEIHNSSVDVRILNKINLEDLTLLNTDFFDFPVLKCITLRKLVVKNARRTMGTPNHLKLDELVLSNVTRHDSLKSRIMLNIPTLRSFTFEGKNLDDWIDEKSLSELKIEELTLNGCRDEFVLRSRIKFNIPTLRSLSIKTMYKFSIIELPNLESLVLVNSILDLDNKMLENLTSLDVCTPRSNIGLDISRQNLPNLRFIHICDESRDLDIDGMLNIILSKHHETICTGQILNTK